MGDTQYPYPVALQWKEDPKELKKLKNKLLVYFQNRSESNGGECEIRDTDCTRGHILIHFKEEKDRDGVLKKDTHELKLPGGKKMKLDICSPGADGGGRPEEPPEVSKVDPTPQPQAAGEAPSNQSQRVTREPQTSVILIENLQDTYCSEMLNLLVENISGTNEETDFQVERIPEKQCAVITFTCDIDILGFVEKFIRNSKVQTMKVKPLEETRTVRVEGLPPNTSEEYIDLYFDNPKHGVPGSMEDTVAIPDEGAALVTFSTVQAAKKVLGMKHLFGKTEVSVYPYYPEQDIVLYGDQRPQIRTPEPLTFPVSPYILEFILSNNQFKDNMEKTMGTHTCEIKWPDLVFPNPIITLSFPESQSTHLRLLVKLLPTWKDEVLAEFSRLISKYKVEEYKMNLSVWDVVKESAKSSTYNGVLIKPELGSGKVFLVGLLEDVTRIDPTFRQLIEETTKQVERKSQSMTETLPMSPALYQIMCNGGLQKKMLDKVPELKVDYDGSRKAIRLSGLKDEVLAAKCEILEIKQEMKSKSIQLNPHLVHFLMSTDNEELSSLLFIRHKINAMLSIEDDAVQLTAYSKKDLTEAEEQMNQELICREVPVEEKSTLKIPEWGSLQSHLLESHNAEKITVLIQDSHSGAENNVVIVGLSSNVDKCYKQVSDFLEKNTPMNKTIKVKSTVVMQFLKEEKKQVLDDLKNDNLSVGIRNKMICLRGPRIYVTEAHSRISDVLSSICSDTLIIDKPGAKKFCLTNEDLYVNKAKNSYKCLIRLQKEEEEEETEEEEPDELEVSQCQINLPNGMVISVHKDDLCRHRADVIVNAANEELKHVGGLALALLKAAGTKLQADSDQIVKSEGRLSAGEAVITDSGRLPCKQVIHTVGPRWHSELPGKRGRLLQKAITSSLELAEEHCHTSIAIPAISSGIFGCPVDQSAENIIKAVKEYAESKPKGQSTIKEIRLVDTNVDTIRIFSSTLKKMFGKEEAEPSPKYTGNRTERGERPVPKQRVYEPRGSANQMMTKENIVIRVREGLIQDAAKEKEEEETEEGEPEETEGSQCQINLPNGMVISVHKDDLCRHRADVIVNAANEDLKHVGGLALALLKAAGPKLQDDSDQIVKSEGRLSAGESVTTDSGRLPCKQVIHTVGPRWYNEPPGKRERLLQKAITSSLYLAEEHRHTSIAIPAISSGIFGCPVDQSAENIIKAIKEYVESKPKGQSTIKEIRLVDTNVDTIRIFSSTLKRMFGKEEEEPSPKYTGNRTERGERPVPRERVYEPRKSANKPRVSAIQMMTKENIVIRIREGLIQDAATEAIVNSVGKDLNLSIGRASKALLDKAGDKLQQRLKDVSNGVQAYEGSVFITEGCNLKCGIVIHVVVPYWDGGQGSSEKIFRDVVRICLCESEKKKLRSITFPAIGTGALGFPKKDAASFMFEEILKFSSKSNAQHLREVNFILHPSDRETLTEFSKELNSRMDRNVAVSFESDMSAPGTSQSSNASAGAGSVAYGTASTPSSGTHEMTIGSVTYQVKTGDITKEDTDIIVNSTNGTFTMRSGVSNAILEAAGQSVIDECTQLGSGCNKSHIVTQSGKLRCKNILHKVGTNSASRIKTFITEALTECARLQATSVAFPAIGTGLGNVSASEVADSILESVADFARSPQSVRMVKVVIFQKQMLNDFHASMKRKEGKSLPKQEGFLTKMKNSFLSSIGWNTKGSEASKVFELRENIVPAIFQLCAESPDAVKNTKVWLSDLIMKEQSKSVITEDWIQEFDEKEQEALFQLQKTHQVSLIIDLPNFTVTVLGLSRDVLEVGNKIQEMIKSVRDKKTREREAELCGNLVEWGYLNGTNFIPFDKITNMELEKAQNEDRQSIPIDINGAKYTVIVELKTANDPRGNTLKLQRNSKHGKLIVPPHWDPMNNENMKVVPLGAGSQEFMDVDVQFKRTCQMRIIKIERIQNRHLWINYEIKKQSIDDKNGSTTNEKQLFHGLDSNTVNSVNHNGFNRSYAGKNAAYYGNGTYFAVNANYSAHDTYSRPDGNGYKYMYLARVVTGVSCVGTQGMIAPPAKNASNSTDLYDSVTNDVANPVMYVIFHDIQAYPEYLITFTK